ncbi:1,3-propanediol dehydrogenase [Paraconexibacter sp. AEG42_29]|uniref:1,3-propanediol dehydrogenase n=1 Tax=Paraconexibacter sp. AEG42_29 TaxID=2997339 RepID=A0AAU7AZA7_9ACTN
MVSTAPFTWQDGERTLRFGRGAIADAPALLGDDYVLLTTDRGRDAAPAVVSGAAHVLDVRPGLVDEIAAELLADGLPEGDGLLVALGGGRVIDTAKALAAATGRHAGAIPTTLSAAEMTKVHRLPAGVSGVSGVRPRVVINDPALSASQPDAELAASAANSLAHAVEAPVTTLASPVPTLAALEAVRLTAAAYRTGSADDSSGGDQAAHLSSTPGGAPVEPDRDALALAAFLSGYGIDAAWYGLSHVCSQTLVRVGGAAHGPANAVVLPHTIAALRRRFPDAFAGLDDACGEAVDALAARLAARAGAARIRDLGVDEEALEKCADAAAGRAELQHTPPAADRDELLAIYRAAW